MKKLVSLLLCLVFVLALVPFSSLEADAATYNLLFPVNNGGKIAYIYGYSEAYGGTHTGIDIHAYGDDTIYAATDGVVGATANSCTHVSCGYACEHYNTYGNYIRINNSDGTKAYYGHLLKDSLLVKVGDTVVKGQPIATMGSSGYSTGKHLHFELRSGDTKINVNPVANGGCIYYSTTGYSSSITYANIAEGAYYLKSNYNGEYLSVAGGKDANKTNVNTWPFAISTEFIMHFTKASQGYKLRPECCSSRLINSYGTTVSSGNNVNIWDDTNESSEWWGFQKVSNGYVIRNMMNPSCVLTVESNGNIIVSTYTGASSQIWSLQNTIQYYANGGSGAPASQIKNYNQSINLSSTKPTRSGYTFLGWSTSESATSATYSAGTSFTKNANTRLYAVWGKNYTVSYNANGGSGAPASQTKVHGVNLTLSNTKPTRAGYTFLGWSTNASAASASYNAGSTFSSNANTTLYAVWSAITYTNTITHWMYVGTGGDNDVGNQKNMGVTTFDGQYGASVTIPTSAIQYYTGYYNNGIAGSGWGYDKWVTKNIGETFTQTANSINIEYYYLPKTVTVEFDKNDGSGETSRQIFQYAEQGKRFGFNSDGTPKWYDNCGQFGSWDRWNHTLLGWSKSPNATTPDYSVYEWISDEWVNANAPDSNPNSTITLYAVWKEDIEGIYPYPPETDYTIKGDINRNGDIDSMDYVLLKRAYFGTYSLANEAVGDINGNGQIDSMDYVLLKRAYFGTYEIK